MSTALLVAAYTADTLRKLREALAAAESRAQAAEARAAMLERALSHLEAVVMGECPSLLTGEDADMLWMQMKAALAASPSPLAQAIEGACDARNFGQMLHARAALRTAWRGAEPGETQI